MKIVKLVDRELTREELESIHRFRGYTDGVAFACLKERVMVMMEDAPVGDLEAMRERALDAMDCVLGRHPDFMVWEMNDGCSLVGMHGGVCVISPGPIPPHEEFMNIILRNEGLEACEEENVIAYAYEEEYAGPGENDDAGENDVTEKGEC